MPQLAVTALSSFLVGLGASAAVATFVATVFVYAATSYLLNRIAQNAGKPPGGLGSGTEVNYYDSGAGGRIAYGLVRTGGMETIPALTGGDNNEILVKALSLTIHEVDSYQSFKFDDKVINYSALTAVTATSADGNVNSGSFRDHAWIRAYRGTSTDSADYRLRNGGFGAFFDTNFRGRGIAKVLVDFKFNRDIYQAVPIVTATYRGKRCYDPRLDVTPGASPTNASYIAWTRNPALTLADYLMATYGGEYESGDIDWATVVTAANYCDGLVNIPGATTQARYTCNGVLMATDQFEDNVKTLVNAMLGRVIFHDGKWRVHAGSWQTPTFTVQKTDWIKGGLSIKFEQGRKVRFNRMRAWYVDPNRDWQRVQSTARYNSTYQAADFDTIDAETDQILCTNEYEAQRKSEFLLRASRNQIVVVGRLPPRFQDIAMWDTGTIVFDHLGWSSKTFRAVGIDMNPDGSMDCVFQEEQSTDWTDMDAADYNTESTATLPDVNQTMPSEPASLSVTNVNGTLGFQMGRPIVYPLNTRFQIIRSTNSGNASVGTVVYDGTDLRVNLVMPASNHWYWGRSYVNPSSFSPFQPNTFGVFGSPAGFTTAQISSGAATIVSFVNCTATQVFSGAGAIHASELGRVDFAAMDADAEVLVTAAYRQGLRNINGHQNVLLRFVTGVTSTYDGASKIPVGGTVSAMQPVTQIGRFNYTSANSAYVVLLWDVASGTNSFTMDQLSLRTEFVRR